VSEILTPQCIRLAACCCVCCRACCRVCCRVCCRYMQDFILSLLIKALEKEVKVLINTATYCNTLQHIATLCLWIEVCEKEAGSLNWNKSLNLEKKRLVRTESICEARGVGDACTNPLIVSSEESGIQLFYKLCHSDDTLAAPMMLRHMAHMNIIWHIWCSDPLLVSQICTGRHTCTGRSSRNPRTSSREWRYLETEGAAQQRCGRRHVRKQHSSWRHAHEQDLQWRAKGNPGTRSDNERDGLV